MKGTNPSPVIDLFAGPGGLGEGFASVASCGKPAFRVALSIEMDPFAHQTLELRSFFRQFSPGKLPPEYYAFLRGEISRNDLFECRSQEAGRAREEAWQAELGKVSPEEVDRRIRHVLDGRKDWVLCGGPPCQAYSIVGRSRNRGIRPRDHRLFLYREYPRILAIHRPPLFIMENVKGLLSSEVKGNGIFRQMVDDLKNPAEAGRLPGSARVCRYHILSLVTHPSSYDLRGFPVFAPQDFVIQCEEYGIPQRRHRVILLGIREDVVNGPLSLLKPQEGQVTVAQALHGLPRLRSGLTGTQDGPEEWIAALRQIGARGVLRDLAPELKREMHAYLQSILDSLSVPNADRGAEFIPCRLQTSFQPDWFLDGKINGICNHAARTHMESDLLRYFYAACFGKLMRRSPELGDFPETLLPAHRNISIRGKEKYFKDRFRVQVAGQPATTITSHIAKDGHYYIHFDPTQCRSLTVREAARLQTFPDSYFFCGPRTHQYKQVGNAVPPLLARQIASLVLKVLNGESDTSATNVTRAEAVPA
jgi:DNA (cytosine-5)-methyltransferase 1